MEKDAVAETLKALLTPQDGPTPSPLSGEEFANYLDGNLPPGQQEEMREHLLIDQDGRDLLLELAKFPDNPWPEDVSELTDPEIQSAWLSVRARTLNAPDRRRYGTVSKKPSRLRLAWAAGITLIVSALGTRILYLENQIEDLTQPQTNPIIEDLFSSTDPLREIDEHEATILAHRQNTPLIFLLHLPREFHDTSIQVALVSASGHRIWQAEKLSVSTEGTVAISFPPGFLQEGFYEIRAKGDSLLQPLPPALFPFHLVLTE